MSKYAKEVNGYLLKIRQGDMEAYSDLFECIANHVRLIAKMYLVDKNSADDVVIDTFVNIYKYIDYFDGSKDGYNWILKIAQNVAFNKNTKKEAIVRAEKGFAQTVDPFVGEERFYEMDFFFDIKGLDEIDRKIAVLRFYHDEVLQTIADKMGISRAAVCKRLQKICKLVEKKFKK